MAEDRKEFDRRAAGIRLRDLASENITPVLRGLEDIMRRYSDKLPTSENDEREYRTGMWERLRTQRDAINGLMDRLKR